jgi:hypothetical protein
MILEIAEKYGWRTRKSEDYMGQPMEQRQWFHEIPTKTGHYYNHAPTKIAYCNMTPSRGGQWKKLLALGATPLQGNGPGEWIVLLPSDQIRNSFVITKPCKKRKISQEHLDKLRDGLLISRNALLKGQENCKIPPSD